ncbi:ligase-associated DNA damage response exonuclease [Aliishimia ponticola]|uniref:Ligase-associated DNA damage response exonuclease n=1 Tax=Aliishimia ponticola TaxID=2499833 RepID=A0A4S4NAG2_9RHOB|nr:ligase-associated DNA damage response exonuclease [Aliishimia ponticola]THH35665.1 ligase-associated DNA damage response exonuclease [Aliishimia ponticola]
MAPLLTFRPEGIYCARADLFIDPWRPVARALITHGHADHARAGMGHYLATNLAAPVLRHRLGDISLDTLRYGETITRNGVEISFHPAGHVPGSAQIRLSYKGETWVASGDYKIEDDGLSTPFAPVRCHHFITESTFGLPVFRWQPQAQIAHQINAWWADCAARGVTPMLGAYSLGKAQRLLSLLDGPGPILTHGAVEGTNAVLRAQGIALPDTVPVTPDTKGKEHPGAIVLAPPSALGSTWARRFGPRETGFASGWMAVRGIRRRRAGDRGFVISDHADWPGLLRAITETGAENIHVTHGYTDIFSRYLSEAGWNADIVKTEFGGDDDDIPDTQDAAGAA